MKINGKQEVLGKIARRGLLLAALLVMVLIFATSGRAQSSATAASTQDAKPIAAPTAAPRAPAQTSGAIARPAAAEAKSAVLSEEKPSAKGAKEGIVVHGHWTIVVKNPDGTIAARQEFENTLDPIEGADLLTGMLSGVYTTDGFLIDLYSANGTICNNLDCILFDSRVPALCSGGKQTNGAPCGTLTYAAKTGASNNNAIGYSLSGAVTLLPTDGGTITTVGTGIVGCIPNASFIHPANASTAGGGTTNASFVTNAALVNSFVADPPGQFNTGASCGGDTGGMGAVNLLLTSRTISQPVTGGQSVAVTVVITFSGS